ncbi:MAG: hypothetical protein ABIQ00_24915 [Chitinophagaceae bacterium]
MKKIAKWLFHSFGFEIRRVAAKGNYRRPMGRMDLCLEDLKQRGLKCKTIMDVGVNRSE